MRAGRSGMVRLALASVAVIGLAFGAACDDDDGVDEGSFEAENQQANAQPDTVNATVVPASGEFTIVAQDYHFEPQAFAVDAGKKVKLTFRNDGGAAHGWTIPGAKDEDGSPIEVPVTPGGQRTTIEFTLNSGRWPFQCPVHPDQMKGTIDVIQG